jgi:transposase
VHYVRYGTPRTNNGCSTFAEASVLPSAFDQINQLTDLRAAEPWLADVPRNVCAQLLVDLDAAWQRCFKRLARRPRWKKKGRDSVAITEPHSGVFHVTARSVKFPKLGEISAVLHRAFRGTPKRCTIRREVDQWFVSIQCEEEAPDETPRIAPVVAIDRGVIMLVADSDGTLRYKLEATGGAIVEVPAAYSSQTCPACGVVDAANRQGDRFRCVGCGYEAHADVNAAIVLLSRGNRGDAGRGGQGAVMPPMKRQLRVVRRGHPTAHVRDASESPGLRPG